MISLIGFAVTTTLFIALILAEWASISIPVTH